jgi:DNA-binding CsgD family transcriptional regulator
MEIRRGRPIDAPPRLIEAAREIATAEPQRTLDLLLDAAWAASEGGDAASTVEIAGLAASVAPGVDDERSRFIVDLLSGLGAIAAGDPGTARAHLERAMAFGETSEEPRDVVWAGSSALWLGDPRAAALLERGAAVSRARGSLGILGAALGALGLQRFFTHQFDRAAQAGAESLELHREVGSENLVPLPLFVLAALAAIRGEDERATALAHEALERGKAHALPLGSARPVWALALLDLGRGRWAEALTRLESLTAGARLGMVGSLVMRTIPDRVEAAVRAGQPELAVEAIASLDAWASRVGGGWAPSRLETCRALVAEGDEAGAHYEESLRLAEGQGYLFDLARTQLLYGEHLRRQRRRTDARLHLRAAQEGFEQLGAEPWAARARSELRATGETARKRDPSTLTQLTPQENQIARLVAEGLSNKEIAAQLFLSPRTIDSHLRNVFSKLSLTSRTQLVRLFPEAETVSTAA